MTPWAWKPQKWSPVRPQPVCTSSETYRIPYSSRTSFNEAKNPSGGTTKPPTPWTGSAIRQATSPAVVVSMTWRRSAAAAALNSSSPSPANAPRRRSPLWR